MLKSQNILQDFISHSFQIYEKLNSKTSYDANFVFDLVNRPEKLIKTYRKCVKDIISQELFFYEQDLSLLRKLKEVWLYEEAMSRFTLFCLLRVWQYDSSVSNPILPKLVKSVFLGCIGYRLIDLCSDSQEIGEEARFLGSHMIRLHESFLIDIFPGEETRKTIETYAFDYCQIEYIEKKNRRKNCPFSWKKPHKIGLKASPLFTIFDLVLHSQGEDKEKILEIKDALIYFVAGIQMIDDLIDAEEDLESGIETLIMSGFYGKFGIDNISKENIKLFLDQKKMKMFYMATSDLFGKARKIFIKHQEMVLLLLLECFVHNFQKQIKFVS